MKFQGHKKNLHGTAETSTTTTMPLFFEAGEDREVLLSP
jgi:hypothetical protein